MISNQQIIFLAVAGVVLLIIIFAVLFRGMRGEDASDQLRNRMNASYVEIQGLNNN